MIVQVAGKSTLFRNKGGVLTYFATISYNYGKVN